MTAHTSVETALAAWCIATHGSAEQRERLLSGLVSGDKVAAVDWSGSGIGVPWAHVADVVLIPIEGQVLLLDPRSNDVTAVREEASTKF